MFQFEDLNQENKEDFYAGLNANLLALTSGETDWLANLCNAAALVYQMMPNINWAGFYLLRKEQLILGPFQGKPACIRINLGKGVCGTAAKEKKPQLVKNVHDFPGHIACDELSKSEIVLPILVDDCLMGVLDIDSPHVERFDLQDLKGLENFVSILIQNINWNTLRTCNNLLDL